MQVFTQLIFNVNACVDLISRQIEEAWQLPGHPQEGLGGHLQVDINAHLNRLISSLLFIETRRWL